MPVTIVMMPPAASATREKKTGGTQRGCRRRSTTASTLSAPSTPASACRHSAVRAPSGCRGHDDNGGGRISGMGWPRRFQARHRRPAGEVMPRTGMRPMTFRSAFLAGGDDSAPPLPDVASDPPDTKVLLPVLPRARAPTKWLTGGSRGQTTHDSSVFLHASITVRLPMR